MSDPSDDERKGSHTTDDESETGRPTDDESETGRPTDDESEADRPVDSRDPNSGANGDDGQEATPLDEDAAETTRDEVLEEIERKRSLRGVAAVVVALVAISFSAFQMWIAARSFTFAVELPLVGTLHIANLQLLQVNAIHVAFALILAFLLYPTSKGDGLVSRRLARLPPLVRQRFGSNSPVTAVVERLRGVVRWAFLDPDGTRVTPADGVLVFLATLSPIYMVQQFDEIRHMRIHNIGAGAPVHEIYPFTEPLVVVLSAVGIPLDEVSWAMLVAAIGVLLVLEATRRALGVLLMGLVSAFLVYARLGYLIPRDSPLGPLAITQTTWESILRDMWFNVEAGVFGLPVTVSVRFIFIFILFGAFLEMSGAGKWFIDFAYSLTGTRRGGPAKASTVASGFMGMLSGSSIANTVTTGAFTIPLMKRSGYSPEFAGAVESSASSGGQILPPVMGAAAFLIVEFIGVPYAEVIIAATLPALAFFFGMWVMVHFEAVKTGVGGLDPSELKRPLDLLASGWFYLVPVLLLLYFLVWLRLSVARAGWFTIIAIVALIALVAAYEKSTRLPLLAAIGGLFAGEVAAYATLGVGFADALGVVAGMGTAAEALTLGEAVWSAAGSLGFIVVAVSVTTILFRPRGDPDHLELDPAVDEMAEHTAAKVGRPDLVDYTGYRLGTFVVKSMESGARTATPVVVAVAAAGVIPGVISVTGLGPNLTALILSVSGESMLALLLLTGISAVIFGMGMPTTVMYIILVAMLGPALGEFGVALLAAHLFIIYFGLMADVTPPVAVAAFAAAGVAKAREFETAAIAFLLSLNKILVPFAFFFSPGILLLRRTDEEFRMIERADVLDFGFFVPEVVVPVVGMFLGVYALGVTIIGYQYAEVDDLRRGLYCVSSIFLMVPEIPLMFAGFVLGLVGGPSELTIFEFTFSLRVIGFALLVAMSVENRRDRNEDPEERSVSAYGDT